MRRRTLVAAALLVALSPAAAALSATGGRAGASSGRHLSPEAVETAGSGPLVDVLVAGRTRVLSGPRMVRARQTSVRASGKRCGVASATPLAALAALRAAGGPSLSIRDSGGACSRRVADGGALFVVGVGPDRNRGRDGWVYKVGRRTGTTGAADPTGPFGTGRRLAGGQRLIWFWCHLSSAGSCQRTLGVSSAHRVAPGAVLHITVTGYDDRGHGVRVAGARVAFGRASGLSNSNGVAAIRAPTRPGHVRLGATRRGLVNAFPEQVRVG